MNYIALLGLAIFMPVVMLAQNRECTTRCLFPYS